MLRQKRTSEENYLDNFLFIDEVLLLTAIK